MTYNIYINSPTLTWDIIHKADKIGGIMEMVLENTISWHSLEAREIDSALDFIYEIWGEIEVEIVTETFYGSYCEEHPYKVVTVAKENNIFGMLKIGDTVKVISKTNDCDEWKEYIPIGSICAVIEIDINTDGTPYYGIQGKDNNVPFYYLESELEKGELVWIPEKNKQEV